MDKDTMITDEIANKIVEAGIEKQRHFHADCRRKRN